MVYSKRVLSKVCILITIIVLITTAYLHEISYRRSLFNQDRIEIWVSSPQALHNCRYVTRYFYFTVDGCERLKQHPAAQLVGRVEQKSDDNLFGKKRLVIQEYSSYFPTWGSTNDWKLQIERSIQSIREAIFKVLLEYISQPEVGFLITLLFGDDSFLTPSIEPLFKTTGTLHILATSGMHLTIVIALLNSLIPKSTPYTFRGVILLCCVSFYLVIVGLQPSMVRAVGMSVHLVLSRYFLHKPYNYVFSLGLVSLLLLLIWPEWLFSPGYQLSVMATFGVVGVHPFLARNFKTKSLNKLFLKTNKVLFLIKTISRKVLKELSVGIVAQLTISPIVLLHFGSIPLLGFLSSALLQWFVPFLTQVGLVCTAAVVAVDRLRVATSVSQVTSLLLGWLPANFFLALLSALAQFDWGVIRIK